MSLTEKKPEPLKIAEPPKPPKAPLTRQQAMNRIMRVLAALPEKEAQRVVQALSSLLLGAE